MSKTTSTFDGRTCNKTIQWRFLGFETGELDWRYLFPFPSLPLEVGPLNSAEGSGEALKLPQRVWGGAPVEVEFGAF